MNVFTSSSYSLLPGDLIAGTVEAKNIIGYSTPSTLNSNGATAKTMPS